MKTLRFVIFALALGGLATSCASKSTTQSKSATQANAATSSAGPNATSSEATGSPSAAPNTKAAAKSHHKKAKTSASSGAKGEGNEVTCTAGGDTRTIQVNKTDQGCEVVYTKNGQTNSVASGNADMKHCDDTSEKIQKNLEGAGYTCK